MSDYVTNIVAHWEISCILGLYYRHPPPSTKHVLRWRARPPTGAQLMKGRDRPVIINLVVYYL